MSKPTVLITGIAGDIGQSIARALIDSGCELLGCDMHEFLPYRAFVERFFLFPSASSGEAYWLVLKDVIVKQRLAFLIPVSEPEIIFLDGKRKELGSLGVHVLMNDQRALNVFLDKLETARFLERLGLPFPKTYLCDDPQVQELSFPLVVKSRRGYGSKSVWQVRGRQEFEELKKKDDGSFIVQEYLGREADEYTTGVFSDGKEVSSITFKRKLGFGGLSSEVELVNSSFMQDLSEKLAWAVSLKGSFNIQTRKIDEGHVPFEVNPRLSSTVLIRKKFGFDDVAWWMAIVQGRGYSYKRMFKSGRAFRCLSELYLDMEPMP